MTTPPEAPNEASTDATAKKRGNPAWVRGGSSPNPGGRSGPKLAITAALRRLSDPEAIARYLLDLVGDEDASHRERLMAAQMVLDRIEGKAVGTLNVNAQFASAGLPREWAQMTEAERRAYLETIRNAGVRALTASEEP